MVRNRVPLLCALLLLSVSCLAASKLSAQGLGGLLNKAKTAKTTAPGAAARQATGNDGGTGLDDSGHSRSIRPADLSTPALERSHAEALMNGKPGGNENHEGREYWRTKQELGFAPAYSADDAFFTKVPNFKDQANYYIDFIDHVSEEFRIKSQTSVQSAGVRAALPKIKAIHFVGTGDHVDGNDPYQGWKFTFDRETGTLNIFFGDMLLAWDNDSALSRWVAKNVK